MLVLNTNQQQDTNQWWNYNIKWELYPDASQALLYVGAQCNIYCCAYSCNVTPATYSVKQWCVNGTPINYTSHNLNIWKLIPENNYSVEERCFYPGDAVICNTDTSGRHTCQYCVAQRFWQVGTLDAGITVGKRFRFQPQRRERAWVYVNPWVGSFNCAEWWVRIKWWLLSSTWAIRYAWCTCRCYKWIPTTAWCCFIDWETSNTICRTVFYGEWEWLVSCKWDRIIVDVEDYVCADYNALAAWVLMNGMYESNNNCCCFHKLFMWNNQSSSWWYATPFQVSLE